MSPDHQETNRSETPATGDDFQLEVVREGEAPLQAETSVRVPPVVTKTLQTGWLKLSYPEAGYAFTPTVAEAQFEVITTKLNIRMAETIAELVSWQKEAEPNGSRTNASLEMQEAALEAYIDEFRELTLQALRSGEMPEVFEPETPEPHVNAPAASPPRVRDQIDW